MAYRFQFSTRNALLATFWIVVWLSAAGAGRVGWVRFGNSDVANVLFAFLVLVPPSAAVGSICGRPALGLLCGLATYAAVLSLLIVSIHF
jgi:hypothetical protein